MNWKRLTAEGAVIVASILLAFWVDAWWDTRQEKTRRAVLMEDLQEEIRQNREQLARILELQRVRRSRIEVLLNEVTPAARGLPEEELLAIQDSVLVNPTFNPALGVLELLIQSGDLTLLESRELRSRLALLPAVSGDFLDNHLMSGFLNLDPDIVFGTGSIIVDHSPWLDEERVITRAAPEDREYAVKAYNTVLVLYRVVIGQGEALLGEFDAILRLMDESPRGSLDRHP